MELPGHVIGRYNVFNDACAAGRINEVKEEVEKYNADVNNTNGTPLHFACVFGHLDVVKYLVEHGADIHICVNNPIYRVFEFGRLDILKYFVSLGVEDLTKYYYDPYGIIVRGGFEMFLYLAQEHKLLSSNLIVLLFQLASLEGENDVLKYMIQHSYNYKNSLRIINFDTHYDKIVILNLYKLMKFHVLLLYRVHDKKLPLELQTIIFNYI